MNVSQFEQIGGKFRCVTYNKYHKAVSSKRNHVDAKGAKSGDDQGQDQLDYSNCDESLGVERDVLAPRSSVSGVIIGGLHRYQDFAMKQKTNGILSTGM